MILIDTLEHLEALLRENSITPEIYAYIEPTLAFQAQECPKRDPDTEGGGFTLHQAPADLLHPQRGLFILNPGERPRLPVAEMVETIESAAERVFAVFVAIDDDSGVTHLLPDRLWLPPVVKAWLEEGCASCSA